MLEPDTIGDFGFPWPIGKEKDPLPPGVKLGPAETLDHYWVYVLEVVIAFDGAPVNTDDWLIERRVSSSGTASFARGGKVYAGDVPATVDAPDLTPGNAFAIWTHQRGKSEVVFALLDTPGLRTITDDGDPWVEANFTWEFTVRATSSHYQCSRSFKLNLRVIPGADLTKPGEPHWGIIVSPAVP